MTLIDLPQLVLLAALAIGSGIWLVTLVAACCFRRRKLQTTPRGTAWPPVTLLKPVYGLEKKLAENLRTACQQDYPSFQVVFSVQRLDDPAIPLLEELAREFGPERVTLAIEQEQVGLNGKINNLVGALRHARHEVLVISDSDIRLRPDYLKAIVAPLADPSVGAVSTFFRATDAGPWYEQMELLTLNADHFAMGVFGSLLGIQFCFGASTALTRETLASIGGLSVLADYLVEDNEMGRRIQESGKKLVAAPYVVDTMVDLESPRHWWQKQTYWDQNTRAAIPFVFAASLVLRVVPIGLAFLVLRGGDALGWYVFAGALSVRMLAAWAVLGVALRSGVGLRNSWLIPVKDVLSLFWFMRAYLKRSVIWRGVEMALTRDGRLLPLGVERAS